MTQSCGTVLSTTDEKLRHDELAFIDKYLARIWGFEHGSRAERRVLLSEVDEDQMKASLLQGALESHRIILCSLRCSCSGNIEFLAALI